MRVSTLIKNVFNDDMAPEVRIVTKEEINKRIKTKMVLIEPEVITKLFTFFVNKGDIEGTALLRGEILGEFLLIKDVYYCQKSEGTSVDAVADTQSFIEASNIDDGNYIVGLAHSHVGGVPVFMSPTDRATQKDFQAMFSDSIALVMNPFFQDGIKFRIYRFDEEDDLKEIPHGYLVGDNEN